MHKSKRENDCANTPREELILYYGTMNELNEEPFDLEAETTSPQLFANGVLKALPALVKAGEKLRKQQRNGQPTEAVLDDEQQKKLGEYLATALIFKEVDSAQDIAFLYAARSHSAHYSFMSEMIGAFQRSQRLELFRPAMFLLHRSCQKQWMFNKEVRDSVRSSIFEGDIPEILQETSEIPDYFDDRLAQDLIQRAWRCSPIGRAEESRKNFNLQGENGFTEKLYSSDQGGWRGGQAWQIQSLTDLIEGLGNQRDATPATRTCFDYMAISKDIVTTIPAARPWCGAIAQAFIKFSTTNEIFRRKIFAEDFSVLIGQANDAEALSLMTALAVGLKQVKDRPAPPGTDTNAIVQKRFEDNIQILIFHHPDITLDNWLMDGDPWLLMERKPTNLDIEKKIQKIIVLKEPTTLESPERIANDLPESVKKSRKIKIERHNFTSRPVSSDDITNFAEITNEIIRETVTKNDTVSAHTSFFLRNLVAMVRLLKSEFNPKDTSLIEALTDRTDLRQNKKIDGSDALTTSSRRRNL
jgi:hypothetical protein